MDMPIPFETLNLQIMRLDTRWDYQGSSSSGPEQLRFFYSTAAGSDFLAYPDLDFTAMSDLGLNAAIDGNDPANRASISGVIAPPSPIGPGETFYLTWHDWNDNSTNDHGLAIDDFQFSAVPEPTTRGISLLGLTGLTWLRRRRSSRER